MQGIYYNYKEFVNSYSSFVDSYKLAKEYQMMSKVSCEAIGKYRRYNFVNGVCEL